MKAENGERRAQGLERTKRWLRIHLLNSQRYDLFYPCCRHPLGPLPSARIRFTSPRHLPASVFLNGQEVALDRVIRSDNLATADLARPELVLPGENVVSLPVRCDPRAVQLLAPPAPARTASPLGWGSQATARIALQDPYLAAAAAFLTNSLSFDIFGAGAVSLTAWDPGVHCVRLWSWYWTTAVVYEALAALADNCKMDLDLSALEQGMLARQILGGTETSGSYMVRWDPDRTLETGLVPWHAPNDSAYLGLHGLLVAHRRTKAEIWLERSLLLAEWIVHRGTVDGRLRVGWDSHRNRWDDSWHYIDAAWTPAFFLELAARTGQRHWADHAEAYARDTLARFDTEGPFFLKIWRANGRHTRTIFSRGMGWVLEGWLPLLAAGNDWLRPRLLRLLTGLLEHQAADGSWPYLLDQPDSGSCNKGTPVLACHLNRARPLFPELAPRLDEAVRRALRWCEAHMELDPDSQALGGIIAANSEGAITTVRRIPTAFNYGSAYYVLTRQECDL